MNAQASTSRWSLDYSRPPTKGTTLDPPGYVSNSLSKSNKSQIVAPPPIDLTKLREQKAWDLALAPAKNVPMQAFMMYMTGGGVQIFSVMSVWFLLKGAVAGVFGVNSTFAPFTTSTTTSSSSPSPSPSPKSYPFLLQKSTFVICQLALLAVGLWKVHNMGLLPTHESDWLAFKTREVFRGKSLISEGFGVGWINADDFTI